MPVPRTEELPRRVRGRSARNPSRMAQERGASNMEIFVILGVVVLWIALQTWILPRFGVST